MALPNPADLLGIVKSGLKAAGEALPPQARQVLEGLEAVVGGGLQVVAPGVAPAILPPGQLPPGPATDLLRAVKGFVTLDPRTWAEGIKAAREALRPAISAMAEVIRGFLTDAGLEDRAAQIDTSGDLFAFLGSLRNAVVNEALLVKGPLSFEEVLRYENDLGGLSTAIVLGSFVFHIVVESVSLGQIDAFIGLLIHLVDDVVGDFSRITSTQLVRRAVGDPLEAGFRAIHRTKTLSPGDAEEAYRLGFLSEEALVRTLAQDGLQDGAIFVRAIVARVKQANARGEFPLRVKTISPGVLVRAHQAKVVSDEEFVDELARQGFDDLAISIYWGLSGLKTPRAAAEEVA